MQSRSSFVKCSNLDSQFIPTHFAQHIIEITSSAVAEIPRDATYYLEMSFKHTEPHKLHSSHSTNVL